MRDTQKSALQQTHLAKNIKHAYRIHSNPAGITRYQQFLNEQFIALGWSKLGDISSLSETDLRTDITKIYGKKGQALGLIVGYFKRLLAMQPGDLIVLSDHKSHVITIAEVTGQYSFRQQLVTSDCAHTVPIRQLRVIDDAALSAKLLKAIQTRTSLITLDTYLNELVMLASGNETPMNITTTEYVEQTTSIGGKNLLLRYPKGITKQQLLDFVSRLTVN